MCVWMWRFYSCATGASHHFFNLLEVSVPQACPSWKRVNWCKCFLSISWLSGLKNAMLLNSTSLYKLQRRTNIQNLFWLIQNEKEIARKKALAYPPFPMWSMFIVPSYNVCCENSFSNFNWDSCLGLTSFVSSISTSTLYRCFCVYEALCIYNRNDLDLCFLRDNCCYHASDPCL